MVFTLHVAGKALGRTGGFAPGLGFNVAPPVLLVMSAGPVVFKERKRKEWQARGVCALGELGEPRRELARRNF